MPTREQNKELVRRFIDEVFNKKNLDYAMEAISDDFVEHQVLPGMTPDKKGTMEQFRVLLEASPDMKAEIHELIASGDRVAIRGTYSGTDSGGFMPGMTPTNKPYSMEGIDIVRWGDDGRILEHWGILDVMGAMTQLGLIPAPGS
ncbi:MAG TPA: ester cyclase [Actinomycetota bacterium]|nr:ester cyclase [Actinomycetota bacterium]